MRTVNIHDAKSGLSKLIRAAQNGEEVIIAKAGTPVIRLVPILQPKKKRKLGLDRGKFEVPEDFDTESSEINALFYGGGS